MVSVWLISPLNWGNWPVGTGSKVMCSIVHVLFVCQIWEYRAAVTDKEKEFVVLTFACWSVAHWNWEQLWLWMMRGVDYVEESMPGSSMKGLFMQLLFICCMLMMMMFVCVCMHECVCVCARLCVYVCVCTCMRMYVCYRPLTDPVCEALCWALPGIGTQGDSTGSCADLCQAPHTSTDRMLLSACVDSSLFVFLLIYFCWLCLSVDLFLLTLSFCWFIFCWLCLSVDFFLLISVFWLCFSLDLFLLALSFCSILSVDFVFLFVDFDFVPISFCWLCISVCWLCFSAYFFLLTLYFCLLTLIFCLFLSVDFVFLLIWFCWLWFSAYFFLLTLYFCWFDSVDFDFLLISFCWLCISVDFCLLTLIFCLFLSVDFDFLLNSFCWLCISVDFCLLTLIFCLFLSVDFVFLLTSVCWLWFFAHFFLLTLSFCWFDSADCLTADFFWCLVGMSYGHPVLGHMMGFRNVGNVVDRIFIPGVLPIFFQLTCVTQEDSGEWGLKAPLIAPSLVLFNSYLTGKSSESSTLDPRETWLEMGNRTGRFGEL